MDDNQPLNCSAGANAFDPDIEGIGVVVSFTATALTAIFSVLSAYLMGSLPGVRHNDIDFLLIDFIRNWSLCGIRKGDTKKALEHGRKYETCFERILIPLADQQLVTSLAIIIAACIKWHENSLYSLEMAFTLATISLITHMTAIRYCPNYLRHHKLLGRARSFAVFLVLGGFIFLMIILDYAQVDASQLTEGVDGESPAAIAWKLKPACILAQGNPAPQQLPIDTFWAVAAIIYYINILTKLYSKTESVHGSSFVYRAVIKLVGSEQATFDDFRRLYKCRMDWVSPLKPGLRRRFCEHLVNLETAYVAIKMSVSADMPWLFFVLIYCLAQLATVWLDPDSPFWSNATASSSFGFGQLITLILLAVPALSGLQAFLGPKELMTSSIEHVETGPRVESVEDADTKMIFSNIGFRRSLYFFLFWNMAVLIYAAIVTGGPWEGFEINVSAISLIVSLFAWEIVLEGLDLLQKGFKGLLQMVKRATRIGRHTTTSYSPISRGRDQQSIPYEISMDFPDSSLDLQPSRNSLALIENIAPRD